MATWLIHRISGLLMIVLVGSKFVSGFFLMREQKPSWALFFHTQPVLDVTLIFLFCLHMCFGLKTILFEIGVRRERALVYGATAAGLALSIVGTYFYLRLS